MNTFQEKFLKAKHWQLFLIMIGLPIVGQIIFMAIVFASALNPDGPSSMITGVYVIGMLILVFICCGSIFGWIWAISTGLQHKVPKHVKMKVRKFKILFTIPIVYLLLLIPLVGGSAFFSNQNLTSESSSLIAGGFATIIIPLHLLSMFGIFYGLYFTAKTFKTVELQRNVQFSDFAGEFFLIWFYFIGVWIIQPKINQLLKTAESEQIIDSDEELG